MAAESRKMVTRSKAQGKRIQQIPLKFQDFSEVSKQSKEKKKEERSSEDVFHIPCADIESIYVGPDGRKDDTEDRDVLVWNGGKGTNHKDVSNYLKYAAETYKIPEDKALHILHRQNNDISKAKMIIFAHADPEDYWTAEEDKIYWFVFNQLGKNFKKIQEYFPNRKMTSIVSHYYATKKQHITKSAVTEEMRTKAAKQKQRTRTLEKL